MNPSTFRCVSVARKRPLYAGYHGAARHKSLNVVSNNGSASPFFTQIFLTLNVTAYNNVYVFVNSKGSFMFNTMGAYGSTFAIMRLLRRRVHYFQEITLGQTRWEKLDNPDFRLCLYRN